MRVFLRRFLPLAIVLLLASGVAGAVIAYRQFRRTETARLYERGVKALNAGDVSNARTLAGLLAQKGDEVRAHLLTGRAFLHAAQAAAHSRPTPPTRELAQQVGQMILSGPGLSFVPQAVRSATWLADVLVQTPQFPPRPGAVEYRHALAEFATVRDDGSLGAEATRLAAECLWRLDARLLAANGLNALLARDPDDESARRMLVIIDIEAANVPEARSNLAKLTGADSDRGRLERQLELLSRASTLASADKPLIELVQKAAKQPWDDDVRCQVGIACLRLHRQDEARAWLRASLACNPSNFAAHRALAQLGDPGVPSFLEIH